MDSPVPLMPGPAASILVVPPFFGVPAVYFDFATLSFHVPMLVLDWARAMPPKMPTHAIAATPRRETRQIFEPSVSIVRIVAPHRIRPGLRGSGNGAFCCGAHANCKGKRGACQPKLARASDDYNPTNALSCLPLQGS